MTVPSSNDLSQLEAQARAELAQATSAEALETWRVRYLGRKGAIPQLLRTVKDLPEAQRRRRGEAANTVRGELEAAYQQQLHAVGAPAVTSRKQKSLSAAKAPGHLHPLTLTLRRIEDIFSAMGFTVLEGPEVEDPTYNFDLLNIPPEHPARAETDTFYLTSGLLLRTQTSPMQIRGVREQNLKPPFSLVSPGRVFRAERTDATHETTFYQFEGLHVSSSATVADFKGVIESFYSTFFQQPVTVRLRPSYFPFVEPGFEVDMQCVFCQGAGCRLCKQTGWLEVMGAGMVHPQVLRNLQLDPQHYQGFAFGGAVDRLAMLYFGITDIRLFWSGDIRFLKQFA